MIWEKNLWEALLLHFFVISAVCSCSDDSTNASNIVEPIVSGNEYEQGIFDPSLNLNVIKNDTTIYNKNNYSNILSNTEKEINTALNNYAVNMMIDYNHSQRNTVMSPISATILYSMMSNFDGSHNQIKKSLNIEDKKKEDINSYNRKVLNNLHNSSANDLFVHNLNLKNKMWLKKGMPVYQSFLSTANFYDVGVEGVDFRNAGDLSVVKDAILNGTADNNIFGSSLSAVCSIVTSYLDFSAEWLYKFSVSKDSVLFVNADNTTSYCHFLSYFGKTKYASFDNFDIIELPYEFSQYTMIVILPHDGTSLSQCLNNVKLMGLAHCVESMKETLVNVRIPEFHYRTVLALNNADVTSTDISQMYHTNLSEISPNGFVLDNIYQSCEIEVSSYGTEATAETWRPSGPITTETSSPVVRWELDWELDPKMEFFAFHPFAVFIRDSENGVIPFAATINTLKDNEVHL